MLYVFMVLSFYNFHERSEFTSIFTSYLTSETSVSGKKKLEDSEEFSNSVPRAGVEPAQVSLSVFETDASTDSAIGA